jgi:dipeptidyl aminopeptidase/acylaminoacyl peptidase
MVDALKASGKPAELLYFPDEGHLLFKTENVRRFWQAAFAFLDQGCRR